MIPTRSGQLGLAEPLQALEEQFVNPEIRRKLDVMKGDYGAYRRCRGDGNCFYRALGFAYLEREVWQDVSPGAAVHPSRPSSFASLLRKVEHNMQELPCSRVYVESALKQMREGFPTWERRPAALYTTFLTDSSMDASLVWIIRALCALACLEHKDSDSVTGDLGTLSFFLCEVLGHASIETFLEQELLRNGAEASDCVQLFAPVALEGCELRLVQLDRTVSEGMSRPVEHDFKVPRTSDSDLATSMDNWPCPDSDRLCLLFKPGHYDILYVNAHAEKVLKLQATMQLERRCCEPWKCLTRFDTEEPSLQVSDAGLAEDLPGSGPKHSSHLHILSSALEAAREPAQQLQGPKRCHRGLQHQEAQLPQQPQWS